MTERARRGPSKRLAQIPYALVLSGMAAGLLWVATHHFKRGTVLLACSVLLAAVFRLVLPEQRVGLLAVRPRIVDVLVLGGLGLGLVTMAIVVPPPPN